MSRANRQIVRLIQELIRLVQSGRLKMRWVLALIMLVVGYFLLQPVLERSLGIDLPALGDLATPGPTGDTEVKTAPPHTASGLPAKGELQAILAANENEPYQSPAGLLYTRGSRHGHRLRHLMAHTRDEPDRPGQHGVFDNTDAAQVVALVDEAYLQAQAGRDTRTQREAERTVYDVNLRRRIGFVGGSSGNRKNQPVARHLRLVTEGNRVITAFPVLP